MVNRGEMIVYLTKAGFPVEVARLIEWFGRVSRIRIEYFMRGLPPLSVNGGGVQAAHMRFMAPYIRGHLTKKGRHHTLTPSWGYLQ